MCDCVSCFFFFQAEDGIRDYKVTGVQTCALPICLPVRCRVGSSEIAVLDHRHHGQVRCRVGSSEKQELPGGQQNHVRCRVGRSEEHTSELQSPCNLVCRLLLEKKNTTTHCSCPCPELTLRLSPR